MIKYIFSAALGFLYASTAFSMEAGSQCEFKIEERDIHYIKHADYVEIRSKSDSSLFGSMGIKIEGKGFEEIAFFQTTQSVEQFLAEGEKLRQYLNANLTGRYSTVPISNHSLTSEELKAMNGLANGCLGHGETHENTSEKTQDNFIKNLPTAFLKKLIATHQEDIKYSLLSLKRNDGVPYFDEEELEETKAHLAKMEAELNTRADK